MDDARTAAGCASTRRRNLFRLPSATPPLRISAIISDHSSTSSRPRWPVDSSLSSFSTLVTRSGSEMRALTIVASSSTSSVRADLSPGRGRSRGTAALTSGNVVSKLSCGNPSASTRPGSVPSATHAGNRLHPAAIATEMKRCILERNLVTLLLTQLVISGTAALRGLDGTRRFRKTRSLGERPRVQSGHSPSVFSS